MKRFGFTLAEILIALAIVGVVAAITLPTFTTSTRNQANATKLAATVSDVENAFSTMLATEGVNGLADTDFIRNNNWGSLANFIKIAASDDNQDAAGIGTEDFYLNKGVVFTDINGNNYNGPRGYTYAMKLKNGAFVYLDPARTDLDDAAGLPEATALGLVHIDSNGAAPPNRIGRDKFTFILGNSGVLYPAGGNVFSAFVDGAGLYTAERGDYMCNVLGLGTGIGCAARLVDNDYQVDY